MHQGSGHICVIASAKGGSGKTTLTVGLAAAGAARGKRTLIIDMDTQANATSWTAGHDDDLLRTRGDQGRGLYRLFIDGDDINPINVRDNLDLIPAGPRTQSLSNELQQMLTRSLDTKKAALATVRDLLHEATAEYDHVWMDSPPSLQSESLLLCALAAADYVLVPFKASSDHAKAAYQVIEQLVRLDELGVEHADPVGVVVFDRDANATRLEHAVHEELERISQYVPVFDTAVIHRPAPAAAALRHNLLPAELAQAAPDAKARLAALRGDTTVVSTLHVSAESAAKYAANLDDVYDEFIKRIGE